MAVPTWAPGPPKNISLACGHGADSTYVRNSPRAGGTVCLVLDGAGEDE